ncbi:MAG: DNA primase regulatory subunit PriL [Metallosphaera yellowstonensis]|jgi:Eukaryotic-type DNA primase, large subunit|uniref:DNA primase large subunit PriL n=1 Tax=Metallosphaera yellowstonensis MK1 TaxID=671065 RepID=H2C9G3_9CREN|nr:DNA primase [Metallosphaera yellowstonensis]EHP68789.1 hypothetical protein MetMK1DRAFT_00032340 [Metallosphaera yellowstonensis MK1]
MGILNPNKYPFLTPLEEVLKKHQGVDLYTIITTEGNVVTQAKERIKDVLSGKRLPSYMEYIYPSLVFYSVLLILGIINDPRVTERVIRGEVSGFLKELEDEDEDVLIHVASWAGMRVERSPIQYHDGKRTITLNFRLHFLEYLRVAKGINDEKLSLSRMILRAGYVYVSRRILIVLLKSALLNAFRGMVRPVPMDQVPKTLLDVIGIRGGRTPPCIRAIQAKGSWSREEAVVLSTYMANVGSSLDAIASVLERAGFERPVETVKEIYRKKFVVYSCSKMKELGLCVEQCGTKSPLQHYFGTAENIR